MENGRKSHKGINTVAYFTTDHEVKDLKIEFFLLSEMAVLYQMQYK